MVSEAGSVFASDCRDSHGCGKYISLSDPADCSYQIIMATEIIGLSRKEREIIAYIVKFNTTEFPYYES